MKFLRSAKALEGDILKHWSLSARSFWMNVSIFNIKNWFGKYSFESVAMCLVFYACGPALFMRMMWCEMSCWTGATSSAWCSLRESCGAQSWLSRVAKQMLRVQHKRRASHCQALVKWTRQLQTDDWAVANKLYFSTVIKWKRKHISGWHFSLLKWDRSGILHLGILGRLTGAARLSHEECAYTCRMPSLLEGHPLLCRG